MPKLVRGWWRCMNPPCNRYYDPDASPICPHCGKNTFDPWVIAQIRLPGVTSWSEMCRLAKNSPKKKPLGNPVKEPAKLKSVGR